MTRLIDADALYQVEKLLDTNIVRHDEIASNLLEQVLYDIQHFPTVTQSNEPLILDSRLIPKVMKETRRSVINAVGDHVLRIEI